MPVLMRAASGSTSGVRGFTLIELSLVLIIIALIAGGVLVGQNLIRAAELRAQVTQIERYNTAVNTFRSKYGGYLPGDIPDPAASRFGFAARGTFAGEGDGNGLIEGVQSNAAGKNAGYWEGAGETLMFWVDLSTAALLNGAFTAGSPTVGVGGVSAAGLAQYFPAAKLGGNYVYVWSGGVSQTDSTNYYGVSGVTALGFTIAATLNMSVAQAYAMDKKIDDGLPLTGTVTAMYLAGVPSWAGTASSSVAVAPAATTCYDNGNSATNPVVYSMSVSGGNNVTCALSFRFQ